MNNTDTNESKHPDPRLYQLEILEHVCKQNAIVYLPTGSGKTYVAILAIKRFSHDMERTIENGGKRAIFMCNTVELARQQALAVRKFTNLQVGLYVGERGVDGWEPKRWKVEITDHQVLVGTAQTFVNIVRSGYIKLSDLSIVIIDECHNATKNHPMHEFMSIFCRCPIESQPRVVGLTGVLLKGNKLTNVQQDLNNLEAVFRGHIVTVTSMEAFNNVLIYSTKPREHMIWYPNLRYKFTIEESIKRDIMLCKKIVTNWSLGTIPHRLSKGLTNLREPSKKGYLKNLMDDFIYQMEDLGLYAASFAIVNAILDLEVRVRQAETVSLRRMYQSVISHFDKIRHCLTKKMNDDFGDDDNNQNSQPLYMDAILNFSTPKLCSLLCYLRDSFKKLKFKDICALIFVERRQTAKCLYNVISSWISVLPELKEVLKPRFMVGRNAALVPTIDNFLERKWAQQVINEFRNGECNLLICSSVLEEGIDVQACNYVFAFDKLKTFGSYIQTKGRARQKDSEYIIFAADLEKSSVITQIRQYQQVHELIRSYLMNRILNAPGPRDEQIEAQFANEIPPYILDSGAFLTAVSALSVLHMYCQILPTDTFGAVLPWFQLLPKKNEKFFVSVRMPLQSNLREIIISDPMSTSKSAKASAALKACIRLHQLGELNDKLNPFTRMECISQVSEQFFMHWKKHNTNVNDRKAGINQRRNYVKLYPEELCNSLPAVGQTCYAYEINILPDFERNDYSEHIYDLLNKQDTNYAILLCKRLPDLAEMQLFMNQGKMRVRISRTPIVYQLENETQLQLLVNYHTMVFREILDLWQNRDFLAIDNRNQQNTLLIVPMERKNIDWPLVAQFQHLPNMHRYSVQERQSMVLRPEDYEGRVIGKWYTPNNQQRFVVTKVRRDMTPQSPFDMEEYRDYIHFYETKYRSEVQRLVQPNQFLIEVRELTSRRNFFINSKNKVNVNRDAPLIRLVPEFCHNFTYPADMWLKALMLPSILQRLHYMLHAEHIRKHVNEYLNLKFTNYAPSPLIVDNSLKRATDFDVNAGVEMVLKKTELAPLPSKEISSCSNLTSFKDEMNWKDYKEPTNFSSQLTNTYQIEVDYYFKFINGLCADIQKLSIDEEHLWEESQLIMPKLDFELNEIPTVPIAGCIEDVPMEEKHRIDILERTFQRMPITSGEQHEFLAAITTSSANDIFDMERLEVLGDSFLKFSVSLYLSYKFPNWHEGFLTAVKSKMVSNRNLLYCMLEKDWAQRIYGQLFRANIEWLPPLTSLPSNILYLLQNKPDLLQKVEPRSLFNLHLTESEIMSGTCTPENISIFISNCTGLNPNSSLIDESIQDYVYKQTFYDKTVADMLEAVLGVCVKNYGVRHSFRMLSYFGILKEDGLENLLERSMSTPLLRTNIKSAEVDGFLINYQYLEKNLGYKFRDRAFLLQALTHPSYPTNRLTGCYQQLEFLGDAILDFLVSCYIFERNQDLTPGKLTDLRMALVNNITLACVCVRHRFHLFLLAENALLAESIKTFSEFQEAHQHRVTDQVRILMEEPIANEDSDNNENLFNLSDNVDVPKALGDIVEALIAAVYLDSQSLDTTWHVIFKLLEQDINQFTQNIPLDPVRALHEDIHAKPLYSPPMIEDDIVMVKCEFRCINRTINVHGVGCNKHQAKKAAAKHALQIIAKYSN